MKKSNTNPSDSFNNYNEDSGYINVSERDRASIELLKMLIKANTIGIVADTIAMKAAINGIRTINKKYTKSNEKIYNPDILAIYAICLGLAARSIVTKVGVEKYKMACEDIQKGESKVNLNNFININFVNTMFIFGGLIALSVAENVYENNGLNIFV